MGRRSKIGVRFDHDCDIKSKEKDINRLVDIKDNSITSIVLICKIFVFVVLPFIFAMTYGGFRKLISDIITFFQ